MNLQRKFPYLFAVLCLAGCGGMHVATGPTQHDSLSVDRDASKTLRAKLNMGAGTLKVGGGAAKWMQGDFTYNVPSWKPSLRYANGDLTVEQPSSGGSHTSETTNEWDLHLNNEVPTDLTVRMGAGEAHLDLGTLSLRSVEIEMGAGELHVDLRGDPKSDYSVRIRGGAGDATVYLPPSVGISAKAAGGLGDIKVRGLREAGGQWVNDAHGTSKPQIRLDIQGGVGQINLIAE